MTNKLTILIKILGLTFLVIPMLGWGKMKISSKPNPKELMEAQLYYTALDHQLKKVLKQPKIASEDLGLLEELILKTGIEVLEDYQRDILVKLPLASVHFLLGKEAYMNKNETEANKWLKSIPRWHRYYPESRFLLSDMARDSGSQKESEALEEECRKTAASRSSEVQSKTLHRYFKVLQEDCQTVRARKLYKAKKYNEAIAAYNRMEKQAYKWPYTLIEKAWSYYKMGDFNRALGILVTYKSPLMNDYFIPEAEVLTALSYLRLCLYEDASIVVDQYYNVYKPRTEALEKLLTQNKNSGTYFYELLRLNTKEKTMTDPFVAQLAEQIASRPRFSLDRDQLTKVKIESDRLIKALKALPQNHPAKPWVVESVRHLSEIKANMVAKVNYYAQKEVSRFVSTVYGLSEELFKIKLEILARKKDLIYGAKKLASSRARGDLSEVKRTRFELFWKFEGAFWADELGDYSFGLESNCKTVAAGEGKK